MNIGIDYYGAVTSWLQGEEVDKAVVRSSAANLTCPGCQNRQQGIAQAMGGSAAALQENSRFERRLGVELIVAIDCWWNGFAVGAVFVERMAGLPELKRMGKAVLVITHDDRYFHLADRVVRLESGKLLTAASETAEVSLAEPSPAS